MRTILSRKQQRGWLASNGRYTTLQHAWSTRGYGSSRISDARGEFIARATGCGYDRRGAALGMALAKIFPAELAVLARRTRKPGGKGNYQSTSLYGLHYRPGGFSLEGGCGESCMRDVARAIGFDLARIGGDSGSRNKGSEYYTLQAVRHG